MEAPRTSRQKLTEWVRRYLPYEIAGTVGELGGAAVAYLLTGSMAAAAITATIGASAAYLLGPLLFDNVVAGWVFAKLFSDIGFYAITVLSYERFKGLLAVRSRAIEEVGGEPAVAVAAA